MDIKPILEKLEPIAGKFLLNQADKGVFVTEVSAILQESLKEIDLDKLDIESKDPFENRMHATLGYACIIAYTYHYIIVPLLLQTCALVSGHMPQITPFDLAQMNTVLFAYLGMGTLAAAPKLIDKWKNNDSSDTK